MARSNGPLTPPGAGRTPRPDPQSWAQGTPPRPAARAPEPGYPQQSGGAFAPQSAGAAYQQAAYGSPPQAATDPRYARAQVNEPRTAPPQPRPAAPTSSSSAFDAFVAQNPPAKQQPSAQPAYPSHAQQPAQPAYGAADYGQHGEQGGFGQWSPTAPAADARGFDYGSFGTAASTGNAGGYGNASFADSASGYGHEPAFGPAHGDQAGAAYPAQEDWGHGEEYGHEPSLDGGYSQQAYGQDQVGALEQSYAEDDYEVEPRRRSKLPLIAAAVAGALLCGGGLAYGYKTFLGPVPSGDTPLIKTSSIPSKVKPDDPGGRKFAHSEPSIMGGSSKVMGGPLGDGAEGPSATDNARKVQTVEVRPDGSVVASDASSGAADDSGPSHAAASASALDFPTAGETGAAEPSPSPQVIAKAEPAPPPPAAREEVADEAPAPVSEPKKVQSKKVAAVSAPTTPIGPAPTGAGWVAVLASVPVSSNSQMDSLKQFADMQQKYGDVLGDKTPSVQEANLGEKGRYHRLVVGPPSSRDSASSICGSLKSAGFTGCWVMQY
jgi:hypothetical protein